jgi:hypothetical protein
MLQKRESTANLAKAQKKLSCPTSQTALAEFS